MPASPRFFASFFVLSLSLLICGCAGGLLALPEVTIAQARSSQAKPELEVSLTPTSGDPGTLVRLEWRARNADRVSVSGVGDFPPTGTYEATLSEATTFSLAASGPGGVTTQDVVFSLSRPRRPPRSGTNPINHVVMMFQENRSFDNYFSAMNNYRVAQGLSADVDVADPNATNPTFEFAGTISRFHMATMCAENTSPAWNESHVQIDTDYLFKLASEVTTSRMNGFVYTGAKYARDQVPPFNDRSGARAMGYYTDADLPYYYFMAVNFAISDRWFSPEPSRSPPNRVFTLAATSNGYVYDPVMTNVRNIFQVLEENGISWKVYYTDVDPQGLPAAYITYFSTFYQAHKDKVVPVSQYFTDLQNDTLPAVAMVESGYLSARDEHPGNNVQVGAAYAASIINALMNSTSWKDSAFFLSYDEAGGLYDHVPPPAAVSPDGISPIDKPSTDIGGDFTRYGMRVPNLVISPYIRPGYVSHTVMDHSAILKFIEARWNLPALTARDNAQSNMYEFFNFSNAARMNAPIPPTQPTTGPCYFDRLP